MSYLFFEDRVASWSALGLVEERNNVLTIYRHPGKKQVQTQEHRLKPVPQRAA